MSVQRIYLLYGSDAHTRDEQVRSLKRRMLEEPFGELNLTELDGDDLSLADVRAAADVVPFMGDRRLVIVRGLVGRLLGARRGSARRGRGAAVAKTAPEGLDALGEYLAAAPPSTALVLVEGQIDTKVVGRLIPNDRAHVREYRRQRGAELERWIDRRARQLGGSISAAAIRRLALLPSDDLGAIDNELSKLVTYADGRAVSTDDVDLLGSSPEVTVFALLDALAERRRGAALVHLGRLISRGERPEQITPQIAGTLHNLAIARDLLDSGLAPRQVEQELGVHGFVAEKTTRQAQAWDAQRLEAALRALLAMDHAIKTGAQEPELALELFVADVTRS